MLRIVSSANVACGFHGGDPTTLRAACAAAAAHGVTIGAQVSYPDLAGFGRRFMDIDADELRDAVLYQLGALDAFAQVAGREVDYVKPHGALYHATIDNAAQAEAVVPPQPSTTRRWRSSVSPIPSCSPPPSGPGWRPCRRVTSTVPTGPTAGSCHVREPARVITDVERRSARRCAWPSTARSSPSTAR